MNRTSLAIVVSMVASLDLVSQDRVNVLTAMDRPWVEVLRSAAVDGNPALVGPLRLRIHFELREGISVPETDLPACVDIFESLLCSDNPRLEAAALTLSRLAGVVPRLSRVAVLNVASRIGYEKDAFLSVQAMNLLWAWALEHSEEDVEPVAKHLEDVADEMEVPFMRQFMREIAREARACAGCMIDWKASVSHGDFRLMAIQGAFEKRAYQVDGLPPGKELLEAGRACGAWYAVVMPKSELLGMVDGDAESPIHTAILEDSNAIHAVLLMRESGLTPQGVRALLRGAVANRALRADCEVAGKLLILRELSERAEGWSQSERRRVHGDLLARQQAFFGEFDDAECGLYLEIMWHRLMTRLRPR